MGLVTQDNAKTIKGTKLGVSTGILYLRPDKSLCPNMTKGCGAGCLFSAGRGKMNLVQAGRTRKTLLLKQDSDNFVQLLAKEIKLLSERAYKKDMLFAVRLDGTSDIGLAERLAGMFPDVQFYDYTKSVSRMKAFLDEELPFNWDLTFSRSEKNEYDCLDFLKNGGSVAAVFETLPKRYKGFIVIPGDQSDLRYLDREVFGLDENEGFWVGLTPKGAAKKDETGFVIR